MHRTGATDLVVVNHHGHEAEQLKDVRQGDEGADVTETDTRHAGNLRSHAARRQEGLPSCTAARTEKRNPYGAVDTGGEEAPQTNTTMRIV